MLSHDGRYALVLNGEIYNHEELRAELVTKGAVFRGRSDTEVFLEAVAQWGVAEAIRRSLGMFALAIWNLIDRELTLARDRVGKKPLYYSCHSQGMVFASEAKALVTALPSRPSIDYTALASYFKLGYVPAPWTIYHNIWKVVPGSILTFRQGRRIGEETYWHPLDAVRSDRNTEKDLTEEEAINTLEVILRDAVRRRMVADVPVGALLSGGIDSSLIVALMQSLSSRKVRTFTVGFQQPQYNESTSAKSVAQCLQTDHSELYVSAKDASSVIPSLPTIYDEPMADSSQIPTFLICRLARTEVTVALSGDGGDEAFFGYRRYAVAHNLWRRLRPIAALTSVAARPMVPLINRTPQFLSRLITSGRTGRRLRAIGSVLITGSPDPIYDRLISLWQDTTALLGTRGTPRSVIDLELAKLVPAFPDRMMLIDQLTYLPDDILVKVDRASMALSLEVRCPLLDHRLIEWAWKLPFRFKFEGSQSKWLMRRFLSRYVPDSVVNRPKQGFGVPLDDWLRNDLREWAEDLLNEQRLRREGVLDTQAVRTAWQAHLKGTNDQYRLWTILMFQAWRQQWAA